MKSIKWGLLIIVGITMQGCASDFSPTGPELAEVVREGEKIFIVDLRGKRWDVTHAVNEYGFVAEQFQFGLGENAILPVLNPKHIAEGHERYPSDDATFFVLATRIRYMARAYPINILAIHEIVDEVFVDVHVAVAF